MNTFIILLRGINVAGQKKVPMAELRQLLTDTGFENVQTYIQSGNIILDVSEKPSAVETKVSKAIENHFGFQVSVLVKTAEELQGIFDTCPLSEEKKTKSYFTLLHDVPSKELVDKTYEITYPKEEFIITDNCVYFYSDAGYGKAKCDNNFFERKLKISATTRNYKTMVKLLSLCQ